MVGVERELEVAHQGLAFVSAGGEQDGGPEVFQGGEVMRPVVDDGVEDGADVGVEADSGVEGVDEGADLGFGDFRFGIHGGAPVVEFIVVIEIFWTPVALRAAYRAEESL